MSGPSRNLRSIAVASALLASTVLVVAEEAAADPIYTDKGNFVRNDIKTSFKTPGGTPIVTPAGSTVMARERQKPGSTTAAEVEALAPYRPATDEQKAAMNKKAKDLYPGITVVKDPDMAYDCHGLTFKAGTVFINNDQVQKIIDDQGWKPPGDGKAKKGDVVIYRKDGAITHSGLVEEVDAAGKVTKVRSKWGTWGEYVHAPADVPKGQAEFRGGDYGTMAEVLTGGKPLKDPPVADDVKIFEGLPPVTLKAELVDYPINDFPTGVLELIGDPPRVYDYVFRVPSLGLPVATGDEITLFADGLLAGFASGDAVSASFGGWVVASVTSDAVTWEATADAYLLDDLLGFSVESVFETVSEVLYRETVAGSVGRTKGPADVPAPATLLLLAGAIAGLAGGCRTRDRRRGAGER